MKICVCWGYMIKKKGNLPDNGKKYILGYELESVNTFSINISDINKLAAASKQSDSMMIVMVCTLKVG